jgi:toxin ParE1/3/4
MSGHSRRLILAPEARQDFSDLLVFTEQQWGKSQRGVYRAVLDRAMRKLTRFPYLGRARVEVSADLRGFPVCEHVIYYRVSDQAVTVVRILHASMDAARQLGGT